MPLPHVDEILVTPTDQDQSNYPHIQSPYDPEVERLTSDAKENMKVLNKYLNDINALKAENARLQFELNKMTEANSVSIEFLERQNLRTQQLEDENKNLRLQIIRLEQQLMTSY